MCKLEVLYSSVIYCVTLLLCRQVRQERGRQLSESEFNAALVGSGIQLNKDEAKKFFKKVDASGDDVVDYKVCFMASSAGCAARSAFLGGSSMHLYLIIFIWLKINKLRS